MTATDPEVAPAGPRSRKGVRTRARLVSAAKEVFAQEGLLDARIAAITERAGVSYGAFYHYFDSKEALFREVAAEVDARLRAPVDEVIFASPSGVPPQDRLREALRRHFETYRDEARLLGVMEQAALVDGEVRAARHVRHRENTQQVAGSLRRLQHHGLVDAGLDTDIAAVALGAMTNRFAEMWLTRGWVEGDFDAVVDTVSQLWINALGLERT